MITFRTLLSLWIVTAFLHTSYANANLSDNAHSGKYSFQVEQSYGGILPTYHHNGYAFVEGYQGQQYNIRVFNHSAKRIEAVVTVDGRDAVGGKIGNYKKNRGYVIDPYSFVLIKGFRTSWNNIASFYFTDIEDSYAARMGSTANVGVIGVAIFEEKVRMYRKPIRIAPRSKRGLGKRYDNHSHAEAQEAAPASPSQTRSYIREKKQHAPSNKQGIGTGYGAKEYSPATQTQFRRKSRNPNAKMAIYYDDHEGLIARGVIRRPRPPARPPHPNPFPANQDAGFAPPPPQYYWE